MKKTKMKRVYRVMMPTFYVTADSKKEVKGRIDELFDTYKQYGGTVCHENRWIKDLGKYTEEDAGQYFIYHPKSYTPDDHEVSYWEDNR
jgi:hypothetical protein